MSDLTHLIAADPKMSWRRIGAAAAASIALLAGPVSALAQDEATVLAAAEARLAELKKGTTTKPPADGPAAVVGKTVWIISCSQSIDLCSDEVNEMAKASEAIGWKTNVTNAEFDPAAAGDQIRQAIAAKADGIIVFGFDCPAISQPLKDAKEAGIQTLGVVALDCDDKALGNVTEPLFTVKMPFSANGDTSYANMLYTYGLDKAEATIALTKGKAQILDLQVPDLVSIAAVSRGFSEGLKKCPDCKVVSVLDLTTVDQVNGVVEQKVTTALAQNPTVDTVQMSTDGLLMTGVQTALQSSGRNDQLLVIGGEGYISNIDSIRSKAGQDVALAFDARWEGWASIDSMNRAFAGAPQVHGGQGWIYVDGSTNLPASGGWDSPTIDFRSAYKAVWKK